MSNKIYDMTDVWNDINQTYTSIKMSINDINSSANSKLIDVLVNGTSKLSVDKNGNINAVSNNALYLNGKTDTFFASNAALQKVKSDPASLTYKRSATAYLTTVYGALARIAWLDDYIAPTDPTISGYPDASAAFARAAADASVIVGTQGKIYYVKDVVLDGRQFDGQNCVLRDAPGARWGIKLSGYGPAARRFVFQDQGNYALSTTLSNAALTAANTVTVVSATGVEVGEVIFVELDANELRHQTFVTGVAGTTLTLRDAIPSGASAGKAVDIMRSAVWVATANRWLVEDVTVVNARGALLTMPEAVGQTSNLGTLRNFQTDGYRFFGWIKAGDCAGVKASDVKLWAVSSRRSTTPATARQARTASPRRCFFFVT